MPTSSQKPEDGGADMKSQRIEDFGTIVRLRANKIPSSAIQFSVMQGKYLIFRCQQNYPLGYVVWADVNLETILRVDRGFEAPKYIYEWDEGEIRFVLDGAVPRSNQSRALRMLVTRSELDAKSLVYRRRGRWKFYATDSGKFKTVSIQWFQDNHSY